MSDEIVRVGIIICHRYHTCAAGKCLRALRNREGDSVSTRRRKWNRWLYRAAGVRVATSSTPRPR